MKKEEPGIKIVQKNKKAFFNYEIVEKIEAGIVLTGPEVKSIRNGRVSIGESYARITGGEVWVINMDISAYSHTPAELQQPKRPRKLLLKKREIGKLLGKTQQKGLTLIPLMLYFKCGYAKIELGMGRGKAVHDKRASMKKKESDREARQRTMR